MEITTEMLVMMIEARHEVEMLKAILKSRKYIGITGEEVALLCKMLGMEEKE